MLPDYVLTIKHSLVTGMHLSRHPITGGLDGKQTALTKVWHFDGWIKRFSSFSLQDGSYLAEFLLAKGYEVRPD